MPKIKWLEDEEGEFYPPTIPQAVIDHISGKSARVELDEKANHGYESNPKTLKSVDDAKADHGYESNPKTLKEVDDNLAQLAGDVSQIEVKDAIQDSQIKDIENVLSTANLNQSAQLSVSGVSLLSLPKNAANGGMSVKLEGLTENVGGVITNFEPTGRVRSVGKNLIDGEKFADLIIKSVNNVNVAYKTVIDGKRVLALKGSSVLLSAVVPFTLLRATGYTLSANTRMDSASPGGTIVFVYDDGTRSSSLFPLLNTFQARSLASDSLKSITGMGFSYSAFGEISYFEIDSFQIEEGSTATAYEPYKETNLYLTAPELRSNGTVKDEIRKGSNGYELVKRISDVDGSVLTTPVITPISYGGILNSAENGTVYHEPVIEDAGVYDTKMDILLTDYPIASIEEIIKHENGVDTYLNVASAVVASDGLSFTHPGLTSGDLVSFTYAFDKESTNGNITVTFYDSIAVKVEEMNTTLSTYDGRVSQAESDIDQLSGILIDKQFETTIDVDAEKKIRFSFLMPQASVSVKVLREVGNILGYSIYFAKDSNYTDLILYSGGINFGETVSVTNETFDSHPYLVLLGLNIDPEIPQPPISEYIVSITMPSEITQKLNDSQNTLALKDKKIAVLGDSIVQGDTNGSWCQHLSDYSGATVYNGGIGGSRLSDYQAPGQEDNVNNLSTVRMAQYLASGDWTVAMTAAANMGAAIIEQINNISQANILDLDLVIVSSGTNDVNTSDTGDRTSSDATTLYGAINSIVTTLLTAKPDLSILILTPIIKWSVVIDGDRFGMVTNEPEYYSDDWGYSSQNGRKLPDIVEAIVDASKSNHVSVENMYDHLGWNKTNLSYFSIDGVHPNTDGRQWMAKRILKAVLQIL